VKVWLGIQFELDVVLALTRDRVSNIPDALSLLSRD
jgi:hypothetical protein